MNRGRNNMRVHARAAYVSTAAENHQSLAVQQLLATIISYSSTHKLHLCWSSLDTHLVLPCHLYTAADRQCYRQHIRATMAPATDNNNHHFQIFCVSL